VNPLISIIVPVYNADKYLLRCLDSILAQTFTDYELIVIDDGSSDNSADIAKELSYKDHRVRLIGCNHGGVSFARNLGIAEARGEWLLFVDADDYLESDHLQHYADHLDADIIWQGYRLFDDSDGSTVELEQQPAAYSDKTEEIMEILHRIFDYGCYFGITWNKLFRTDIIRHRNIRFDETVSFREDELFTFQYCIYIYSVRVLPTSSYNYRQTVGSLMRSYHTPETVEFVADKIYEVALRLPLTTGFRNSIEAYFTDTLACIGWIAYERHRLRPRAYRLHLLSRIIERNHDYPTKASRRAAPFNAVLSDYYHLMRYAARELVRLFVKR